MIFGVLGVRAELPLGGGGPGPDPLDPDDLLIPGMFEPNEYNVWEDNDDYFIDRYGYTAGPNAKFLLPPDSRFVPGGVYILSGFSQEVNDFGMEVEVKFRAKLPDIDEVEGETIYQTVFTCTSGNSLKKSGYMRIPEGWNNEQNLEISTHVVAGPRSVTLKSIKQIVEDPDELLRLDVIVTDDILYFDLLSLKVNALSDEEENPYYPMVDFVFSLPEEWVPGGTYEISGTSEIDTSSIITGEIGYYAYQEDGPEIFTTDGSTSAITLTSANADGWTGTFTISEDWLDPEIGERLALRFTTDSLFFHDLTITSIKVAE